MIHMVAAAIRSSKVGDQQCACSDCDTRGSPSAPRHDRTHLCHESPPYSTTARVFSRDRYMAGSGSQRLLSVISEKKGIRNMPTGHAGNG